MKNNKKLETSRKNVIKEAENRTVDRKRGGLNWQWTGLIIFFLVIGGIYLFLKVNPPLEVSTIAANEDNKTALIGIGNRGFSTFNIIDVTVNNDEQPVEAMLQVSDAVEGFAITNERKSAEAEGVTFKDLDETSIKTGTSFDFQYDEDGNPEEGVEIFAVNVFHDEPIHTVQITYRHFGITYDETVEM